MLICPSCKGLLITSYVYGDIQHQRAKCPSLEAVACHSVGGSSSPRAGRLTVKGQATPGMPACADQLSEVNSGWSSDRRVFHCHRDRRCWELERDTRVAGSGAVSVQSANLRTMKAFLGQPGCGGLNGRGLRKDEGPQRAAKGNNTGERTGLARGQGSRDPHEVRGSWEPRRISRTASSEHRRPR